jgi:hypothetical protein
MNHAGWLGLVALLGAAAPVAAISNDSTLIEKAEYFQRRLVEKHWLDGLYMSIVPVTRAGQTPDHTVEGPANVIHAGVWTGRYLGGVGYQYAVTRDPAVRKHGGQILQALRVLQEVTGKPGLLARGYVRGHGPTGYERGGGDSAEWHQGQGRYSTYRWYGDVSVDNFNAVLYGYAIYYDLAADEAQKKIITHDVDRLMTHLLDNHCRIIDVDGEVTRYGHVGIDPDPSRDAYYQQVYRGFGRRVQSESGQYRPSLRASLMLLPDLLIAAHITGKPRYRELYDRLLKRFLPNEPRERTLREWSLQTVARVNHSSEGQAYEALYNLIRLEHDAKLKELYKGWMADLWAMNKTEGNSLFSFMTQAFFSDTRPDPLALETLRRYPVDRVLRPVMNSLDPSLPRNPHADRANDPQAAIVVPMDRRPLDNEYEWKGNPYRLDGWLKPAVVAVASCADDPLVGYAADSAGQFWMTRDAGRSWEPRSFGLQGARVLQLGASPRRTYILVAATDRGLYRTLDGGLSWRAAQGAPAEAFRHVRWAPGQPARLLAATDRHLFRSDDAGVSWTPCQDGLPDEAVQALLIAPVPDPRPSTLDPRPSNAGPGSVVGGQSSFVALVAVGGKLYRRGAEDAAWAEVGGLPLGPGMRVNELLIDPGDPAKVWLAADTGIYHSQDGGGAWEHATRGTPDFPAVSVALDPGQNGRLFAVLRDRGVFVSADRASTWKPAHAKMRIPRGYRVFGVGSKVWASTPGGLYETGDGGRAWREVRLWPEHETGSADFLHAYWMGRYYGFVPPPTPGG